MRAWTHRGATRNFLGSFFLISFLPVVSFGLDSKEDTDSSEDELFIVSDEENSVTEEEIETSLIENIAQFILDKKFLSTRKISGQIVLECYAYQEIESHFSVKQNSKIYKSAVKKAKSEFASLQPQLKERTKIPGVVTVKKSSRPSMREMRRIEGLKNAVELLKKERDIVTRECNEKQSELLQNVQKCHERLLGWQILENSFGMLSVAFEANLEERQRLLALNGTGRLRQEIDCLQLQLDLLFKQKISMLREQEILFFNIQNYQKQLQGVEQYKRDCAKKYLNKEQELEAFRQKVFGLSKQDSL